MLKKISIIVHAGLLAVVGTGVAMYFVNAAPAAPPIQIEKEYAGRVNFLVLDFTDDQTTDASRAAAERTKDVTASIAGSRDIAGYRAAIDSALNRAPGR